MCNRCGFRYWSYTSLRSKYTFISNICRVIYGCFVVIIVLFSNDSYFYVTKNVFNIFWAIFLPEFKICVPLLLTKIAHFIFHFDFFLNIIVYISYLISNIYITIRFKTNYFYPNSLKYFGTFELLKWIFFNSVDNKTSDI